MSQDGAWNAWLEYFVNGVARQAEDGLSRASKINALLADWRREIAGTGTKNAMLLVDVVVENPFVTIKGAAKRLDVAFTTAQRAIDALQRAGILHETTAGRRDRVFCAHSILEILEAPTRLGLR